MNIHTKEKSTTAFYLFLSLLFLSTGLYSLSNKETLTSLLLIGGGVLYFLCFYGRKKRKRSDLYECEYPNQHNKNLVLFACYLPSLLFFIISLMQALYNNALWSALLAGAGILYYSMSRKEILNSKTS